MIEQDLTVMSREPRAARRVRVLIADADPFSRRTVRDALQAAAEIVVVADAESSRELIELGRHFRPDVVLAATGLPTIGGIEAACELMKVVPETRVGLLATRYEEEEALRGVRAGAVAYLCKQIDPNELRDVVRRLVHGEAVIPATLTARVLTCLRAVPDTGWRPVKSRLTSREWEIVDLMGTGASTRTIAERLVLSPATVYSHVKSVLRKLGVHSRPDAVDAAEQLRHEEIDPRS